MRERTTCPRLFIPGLLLIAFALGYVSRQPVRAQDAPPPAPYAELSTFARVLGHVEQSYVDPIETRTLIYGAIKGMMRTLDPHSAFLTPEELQRMRTETRGEYVGVGLEIGARDQEMVVIVCFEGGPAQEAGLLHGDVVLDVDGESTLNRSVPDVVNQLRGEQGVPVQIRIRRDTEDNRSEYILFTVIRDMIHMQAVDSELLAPSIGMIGVSTFQANVTDDVVAAIDDLEVQNGGQLDGLVLDLRSNPGGLLNEAITLSDIFLDEGVVVTTEGRNPLENEVYRSRSGNNRFDGSLVVLVNGGTASASEIVAGALQDLGRATLVGTTTFGKATVQSIYNFEDGSGLKLTVARYFTPNHRSIHDNGLDPDIEVLEMPFISDPTSGLPDGTPSGPSLSPDPACPSPFEPVDDSQIEAGLNVLLSQLHPSTCP